MMSTPPVIAMAFEARWEQLQGVHNAQAAIWSRKFSAKACSPKMMSTQPLPAMAFEARWKQVQGVRRVLVDGQFGRSCEVFSMLLSMINSVALVDEQANDANATQVDVSYNAV